MQFKGFTLDKFQEDAVNHIENNLSVIVSAPTGTGKTLIADFVIDKFLNEKQRVVYTAPIKALSNQKYKEFCEMHGQNNIGLITGDVVINPHALILIMTTEVYRNMLLSQDRAIDHIAFVIFDEIHFINDVERGTVWEESIMFSPDRIRFLCLSATVPNHTQFADWISKTKHHEVKVVVHKKRAVTLHHKMFTIEDGFVTPKELYELSKHGRLMDYNFVTGRRKKKGEHRGFNGIDVITQLNASHSLPVIYFIFSRVGCERFARTLLKTKSFISKKEQGEVAKLVSKSMRELSPSIKTLRTTQLLRRCLERGVGFHHAGLLPKLKEIVEILFSKGLVKVLFATETFAVGINMPAKSVIIDSPFKYDGISFRYLTSTEYYQMAGRAGRRGIDEEGTAIVILKRHGTQIDKIKSMLNEDTQPLKSQFKLSYNTVLNLIKYHSEEEIEIILKKNFYHFQRTLQSKKDTTKATFARMKKKLIQMGFIKNNLLTEQGDFASGIYTKEIETAKIFSQDLWKKFKPFEIFLIICALIYEPRAQNRFPKSPAPSSKKIMKILHRDKFLLKKINPSFLFRLEAFAYHWFSGGDFTDLLLIAKMLEGDIIRFFRQTIDLMMQIRRVSKSPDLSSTMDKIINKTDRDVVRVVF